MRTLGIDPIEALARIGVDPDTLGDVILTHLHYDHASNIERLPAARLHVHADETAYATGPCMCHEIARRPYDVEDMVTLIRRLYAERVRFHEEGASPWPGITLREFPGHSAMVMGVEVATARGPVILASDAAHYYANILDRRPFVLTVDMTATLASYDRIEALAGDVAHLIPGHDPKVARIYPSRVVNGVELWALHEPPAAVDAAALADTSDY